MPAPARVLFVHSSSGRYGADRQLLNLAAGLDPARFTAAVVLPGEGELADELRSAGVEIHVRPIAVLRRAEFTPLGVTALATRAATDAVTLGRFIRRRGISLVHSNTSVILSGATAARTARVPHVVSVREIYADFARLWPAYRRFLLLADRLCCPSAATCSQFGGHPRARVVYDGVKVSPRSDRAAARRELDLPPDAFVCAVLGRISSWKGQDVLARALAEPALAQASAIGLVAGDAWPGQEHYETELRALAGQLGLDSRFRMVGFRPDPADVYAAADVIVVPSTQPDPLPNSALEAAVAGCCVVAADHGGLPEIIEDGRTGRLVAAGNHRALAEVLEELRENPDRRISLGSAAARAVSERFSVERLLDTMQEVYGELLDGRTRS